MVGLGKGTFYNFFTSKEEFVYQLIEHQRTKFWGHMEMLKGSLTAAECVFFIIMSIVFLAAFNNLMSFAQIFSQISAGIERIKLVMDVPELVTEIQKSAVNSKSFIELRGVSFAYKEKNVLEHIDLSLAKGSLTAFVGASGAEKSTAAQILPRFRDVTEGEILIDSRNIKSYSSKELMSMLSFVFQETFDENAVTNGKGKQS